MAETEDEALQAFFDEVDKLSINDDSDIIQSLPPLSPAKIPKKTKQPNKMMS